MKKVILLFIAACLISCGPPANEPPDVNANTSSQLFLELWEIFDREYAFFDVRQVDWDTQKVSGLEKARSAANDSLLFVAFCEVLKEFDDSHINLESDKLEMYCNAGELPAFFREFPSNESFTTYLTARNNSLKKIGITRLTDTESGLFQYGLDRKNEWGYLRIKRFYGADLTTVRTELNQLLPLFEDVQKIICDIRINPGGNDETAMLCAGYFFKRREIAFIKQTRRGPGHEDFSLPDTTYVIPNETLSLRNEQIFLLTNGASGSSADVFALVMSYLPNVTVVGTNTEGIFSNMYRDTLSNGWRITLSNERYYSKDMICYEKIGIPVDVSVENNRVDAEKGIDLIIEEIAKNN